MHSEGFGVAVSETSGHGTDRGRGHRRRRVLFEPPQQGDLALFPSPAQRARERRSNVVRRILGKLRRQPIDAGECNDRVDGLEADVGVVVAQRFYQRWDGFGEAGAPDSASREDPHPCIFVLQRSFEFGDRIGLPVARESVGCGAPDLHRRVREGFAQRSHRGLGKQGRLGGLPAPHGDETQAEQGVGRLGSHGVRHVLEQGRDRQGGLVGGQLPQGLDRACDVVRVVAVE